MSQINQFLDQTKALLQVVQIETEGRASYLMRPPAFQPQIYRGLQLLQTAENLHHDFVDRYKDRDVSLAAIIFAVHRANLAFTRHWKLAWASIGHESWHYTALSLDVPRKRSLSGWFQQAADFYAVALEFWLIQHTLASVGISFADLQRGHDMLNQADGLNQTYRWRTKTIRADAQQRDAALDDLAEWLVDFIFAASQTSGSNLMFNQLYLDDFQILVD